MSEAKTLFLTETGIARDETDGEAVNVGPIVAALRFLTEGRGDDRGIDADGEPLPDLLSLAFDVVRSIVLGGTDAEFFREVKAQFDARAQGRGASIGLAKRATLERAAPLTAVTRAKDEVRRRLKRLDEAAAQLELELAALQGPKRPSRRRKATKKVQRKTTEDKASKTTEKVQRKTPKAKKAQPKAARATEKVQRKTPKAKKAQPKATKATKVQRKTPKKRGKRAR